MENTKEVKQAEAHLIRAEAELEAAQRDERAAEAAEQAALKDIDTAVQELREEEHHHREIHFSVDGEDFETCRREWTPNEIIKDFGKKDPATNYLVAIHSTHNVSDQGKGGEKIEIHECEAFQIVSTGPTPVSDATGSAEFSAGLRDLGYDPQTLGDRPDHVFFNYPIDVGRFAGQAVRLGFVVPPDFPNITPSGPHVSPRLRAIHPGNDVPHPAGGCPSGPVGTV